MAYAGYTPPARYCHHTRQRYSSMATGPLLCVWLALLAAQVSGADVCIVGSVFAATSPATLTPAGAWNTTSSADTGNYTRMEAWALDATAVFAWSGLPQGAYHLSLLYPTDAQNTAAAAVTVVDGATADAITVVDQRQNSVADGYALLNVTAVVGPAGLLSARLSFVNNNNGTANGRLVADAMLVTCVAANICDNLTAPCTDPYAVCQSTMTAQLYAECICLSGFNGDGFVCARSEAANATLLPVVAPPAYASTPVVVGVIVLASLLLFVWLVFVAVHELRSVGRWLLAQWALCTAVSLLLYSLGRHWRDDSVSCAVVAVAVQFFALASFVWLVFNSIFLAMKLLDEFTPRAQHIPGYLGVTLMGYVIPAIITAVGAGSRWSAYGSVAHVCWIATPHMHYVFVLPTLCGVLVTIGVLGRALRSILHSSGETDSVYRRKRAVAVGTVAAVLVLALLLIAVWTLGLLSVHTEAATSTLELAFAVSMAIFGLVFVGVIFLSDMHVRSAMHRLVCCRLHKDEADARDSNVDIEQGPGWPSRLPRFSRRGKNRAVKSDASQPANPPRRRGSQFSASSFSQLSWWAKQYAWFSWQRTPAGGDQQIRLKLSNTSSAMTKNSGGAVVVVVSKGGPLEMDWDHRDLGDVTYERKVATYNSISPSLPSTELDVDTALDGHVYERVRNGAVLQANAALPPLPPPLPPPPVVKPQPASGEGPHLYASLNTRMRARGVSLSVNPTLTDIAENPYDRLAPRFRVSEPDMHATSMQKDELASHLQRALNRSQVRAAQALKRSNSAAASLLRKSSPAPKDVKHLEAAFNEAAKKRKYHPQRVNSTEEWILAPPAAREAALATAGHNASQLLPVKAPNSAPPALPSGKTLASSMNEPVYALASSILPSPPPRPSLTTTATAGSEDKPDLPRRPTDWTRVGFVGGSENAPVPPPRRATNWGLLGSSSANYAQVHHGKLSPPPPLPVRRYTHADLDANDLAAARQGLDSDSVAASSWPPVPPLPPRRYTEAQLDVLDVNTALAKTGALSRR